MATRARVLVADDDPELLETVADVLTRLEAEVIRARTGSDLIDHLADSGPFDLVVTDVSMPWMTGLGAMQAARTAGLGVPVIVMTALRDKRIPPQVNALGATLLLKPFTVADLKSVVERLLSAAAARQEGR